MPTAEFNQRALILFPGALGDFLCALPSVLALQRAHREVLVLANPGPLELIEYGPFLTASMQRREVADLFAAGEPSDATRKLFGGFAVTHSWTGSNHPGFAARLQSVTGGRVHLHEFRGMASGEHVVDYYARCVGLIPARAQVWTTPADDEWAALWCRQYFGSVESFVLIHPGSGAERKNWEGFAMVVEHLRASGASVAVVLGPAESERTLPSRNVATVRDANLRQVAALLRRAALYVGNDSGVSHLAAAVGTRSLVLFGATDALRWAPMGATIIEAVDSCPQCGPDRLCTHRIPVERVLDAIERLTTARW
ncbi:MAG TPA: glycosyltransferase family 9 protein [Candidatus Binatia bacterium]|nr:glycosyltransferase family 9 protein [Candidatus Binatia bacterium]